MIRLRVRGGEPGFSGKGGVDGIDDSDTVVACGRAAGTDPVEPAEGLLVMPVPRHGLMSSEIFDGPLAGIVGPFHLEGGGAQPHLVGMVG